jgi:hypothetical protein
VRHLPDADQRPGHAELQILVSELLLQELPLRAFGEVFALSTSGHVPHLPKTVRRRLHLSCHCGPNRHDVGEVPLQNLQVQGPPIRQMVVDV